MSLEVELKLSLSADSAEQFLALTGFHQHASLSSCTVTQLDNRYFDTDSLTLLKSRAALRIRKAGDQYLQTLKTKGKSIGGLHQRGEWEFPISTPSDGELPSLEPELFPKEVWPDSLNVQDLRSVFETNFQRSRWIWSSQCGSRVELVLDQGSVTSGDQVTPLCEMELELMEGSPSCLFDLAEALSKCIPVTVSDITKAQRGFELFQPGAWQTDFQSLSLNQSVEHQLSAMMALISNRECNEWLNEGSLFRSVGQQLIDQRVLSDMDFMPWLLLAEMGELDALQRGQWLLRLARQAWRFGVRD